MLLIISTETSNKRQEMYYPSEMCKSIWAKTEFGVSKMLPIFFKLPFASPSMSIQFVIPRHEVVFEDKIQ